MLVGDFGIARDVDATVATYTGTASRTDAYAPPEQRADRRVDRRADVYAPGVTCYELLTGHLPTVVVGRVRDRIPSALRPVLAKATAGEPEDRNPSCGAFAQAVAAALGGRSTLRLVTPARVAIAGTVAAGLAFGALLWAVRSPSDSRASSDTSAQPSAAALPSAVTSPPRCRPATPTTPWCRAPRMEGGGV
ncbi:protein kinase [Nocardia sp. NPDC051787]|uniref:protein kinase n=1 Tax=Nocardia sp. NPDC051787 TaxID=3155415 RepID=UPI003438726C